MEELAAKGATVYTCARTESKLGDVLGDWNARGFDVRGSVCDVSDRAQRELLIDKVSSEFCGKLNILVSFWSLENNVTGPWMRKINAYT